MQTAIGEKYQFRVSGHYSSHFSPNAKYEKETVYLFGNNAQIYGFVDDDYNSNDTLLNAIEHKNPSAIILGGTAYTDMEYFKKGHLKYFYRPKFAPVTLE